MGPLVKIGKRYVDTAVFGCPGLQGAGGIEMNCASLKTEIDGLTPGTHDARGTGADQRIVRVFRPSAYRPPCAIQFLDLVEICAADHHGMTIVGASNGVSERNCESIAAKS